MLLIFGLFSDSLSTVFFCTTSNGRIVVNEDLERIWKKRHDLF